MAYKWTTNKSRDESKIAYKNPCKCLVSLRQDSVPFDTLLLLWSFAVACANSWVDEVLTNVDNKRKITYTGVKLSVLHPWTWVDPVCIT